MYNISHIYPKYIFYYNPFIFIWIMQLLHLLFLSILFPARFSEFLLSRIACLYFTDSPAWFLSSISLLSSLLLRLKLADAHFSVLHSNPISLEFW